MKKTTKKSSGAVKLGVLGASIAGLAAAYYFLGPKGKKHQERAKAWAIKMKGDVVERLEKSREVSESIYKEIIDSVAADYKKGKRAGREEIESLSEDLKKHWNTIGRGAMTVKRDATDSARRVAMKMK